MKKVATLGGAQKNQRQLNIELLRIFSMLLITVWHIKFHFIDAINIGNSFSNVFMNYVVTFISFHVDLFILITGYFGINDSKKALLKTLLLVFFYSIILGLITGGITGEIDLKATLLPISSQTWWFMTMYIAMVMIAPLIEDFLRDCNRRRLYLLTLVGLFLNLYLGHFHHVNCFYYSGYGITNFFCVYIIGAFIRKEGEQLVNRLKYPRLYIILAILVLIFIHYKSIPYFWTTMNEYCAPYPLCMSTLVFLLFLKIRIPECFRKYIMFLSSSAIAVYLITDHISVRELLMPSFMSWFLPYQHSVLGLVIIVASTMIAYIGACIIDQVRIQVTKYLNSKICKI